MIQYTEEKIFTKDQIEHLFLSVHWISGEYPDGDRLVGLLRALDDSEMLAYIHYVLVDPQYQGKKIAGTLVEKAKEIYKDYVYIEGMPEESKNVPFYQKHGFQVMKDGVPIVIRNYGNRH